MFGVILIQNGLHNQLNPPSSPKKHKGGSKSVRFAEIDLKFDVSVNQNLHSERDR